MLVLVTSIIEYGERSRISSATIKKKPARRCEAVDECNHYDYPTHMLALGKQYQAHYTGCRRVGPAVNEGPWTAQRALYLGKAYSATTV